MPAFGAITRVEMIRAMRALGFVGPYSGGKHQYMVKAGLRLRIPNPHRRDVGKNLLRAILREAGISIDDWEKV